MFSQDGFISISSTAIWYYKKKNMENINLEKKELNMGEKSWMDRVNFRVDIQWQSKRKWEEERYNKQTKNHETLSGLF